MLVVGIYVNEWQIREFHIKQNVQDIDHVAEGECLRAKGFSLMQHVIKLIK